MVCLACLLVPDDHHQGPATSAQSLCSPYPVSPGPSHHWKPLQGPAQPVLCWWGCHCHPATPHWFLKLPCQRSSWTQFLISNLGLDFSGYVSPSSGNWEGSAWEEVTKLVTWDTMWLPNFQLYKVFLYRIYGFFDQKGYGLLDMRELWVMVTIFLQTNLVDRFCYGLS